jgi:hypothetical protein
MSSQNRLGLRKGLSVRGRAGMKVTGSAPTMGPGEDTNFNRSQVVLSDIAADWLRSSI